MPLSGYRNSTVITKRKSAERFQNVSERGVAELMGNIKYNRKKKGEESFFNLDIGILRGKKK